jgi:hypothetical protein
MRFNSFEICTCSVTGNDICLCEGEIYGNNNDEVTENDTVDNAVIWETETDLEWVKNQREIDGLPF